MSELETFRAEARAWLEENCPAEMRTPATVPYTPLTPPTNREVYNHACP